MLTLQYYVSDISSHNLYFLNIYGSTGGDVVQNSANTPGATTSIQIAALITRPIIQYWHKLTLIASVRARATVKYKVESQCLVILHE